MVISKEDLPDRLMSHITIDSIRANQENGRKNRLTVDPVKLENDLEFRKIVLIII